MKFFKPYFSNHNWLVVCLLATSFGSSVFFYTLPGSVAENLHLVNTTSDSQVAALADATRQYPTLKPPQGLTDPTLAYGLNGGSDYSPSLVFLDLMKHARPFFSNNKTVSMDNQALRDGGYLDITGWPKKIPSGMKSVSTVLAWGSGNRDTPDSVGLSRDLLGRYELTYDGEGKIELGIRGFTIVSTSTGRIIFDLTGITSLFLDITITDPNNTGNYLRNIKIIKQDNLDLYNSGEIFNPNWIKNIKDTRQVRFMDWMEVNGASEKSWEDLSNTNRVSWVKPVPLPIQVRLANKIGVDPWFNIPFLASDETVRKFAQYIKDNLDPNLRASVELSNEVWNFLFLQAHQANDAGVALWNIDPKNTGATWVNYYGMRAAKVMKVITEVYGSEAQARLQRIVGTQALNTAVTNSVLDAPVWKKNDPTNYFPPANYFDAVAATTYFGVSFVTSTTSIQDVLNKVAISKDAGMAYQYDLLSKSYPVSGTVSIKKNSSTVVGVDTKFDKELFSGGQLVINGQFFKVITINSANSVTIGGKWASADVTGVKYELYKGDSIPSVLNKLKEQKNIAAAHGLKLVLYEGGQHIHHGAYPNGFESTAQFAPTQAYLKDFVRSSYMADLYQKLWDGWKQIGDGPFMQFVEVGNVTKYGSWGSRVSNFDVNPRVTLLDKLNASTPAWFENRGGIRFQQGYITTGGVGDDIIVGSIKQDNLIGLAGDDVFYAGSGDDGINGGNGTDTVIFKGNKSQYTITPNSKGYNVTGPDGRDYVFDVEILQFDDGQISPAGAVIVIAPTPITSSTSPATGPAVTLTISTTTVMIGGSVNLTWNSNESISCAAGGSWSGAKSVNGSESIGPLTTLGVKNFTLNCVGNGGKVKKSVSAVVTGSDTVSTTTLPTVSITATPLSVTNNQSKVISWTSTNAQSCVASGAWEGSKAVSGTETTGPLSSGVRTFFIRCKNSFGFSIASARIDVASVSTTSKFKIGNIVELTESTNVKTEVDGKPIGKKGVGALGIISNKLPMMRDGLIWIYVDFENGIDGYVTDVNLKKSSVSLPDRNLIIGKIIQTTEATKSQQEASIDSSILGRPSTGEYGKITQGPQIGIYRTWWYVDFASTTDGWVSQNYLKVAP